MSRVPRVANMDFGVKQKPAVFRAAKQMLGGRRAKTDVTASCHDGKTRTEITSASGKKRADGAFFIQIFLGPDAS